MGTAAFVLSTPCKYGVVYAHVESGVQRFVESQKKSVHITLPRWCRLYFSTFSSLRNAKESSALYGLQVAPPPALLWFMGLLCNMRCEEEARVSIFCKRPLLFSLPHTKSRMRMVSAIKLQMLFMISSLVSVVPSPLMLFHFCSVPFWRFWPV